MATRPRKRKPSFEPPASAPAAGDTGWVYRSEREKPPGAVAPLPAAVAPELPAESASPAAAPVVAPPPLPDGAVRGIVDSYALYGAAAGLVPVPIIDAAAIAAVQVAMVRDLARHFGVPFSRERGKTIVGALVGGLTPAYTGRSAMKYLAMRLPLVGAILTVATVPAFASAATYAVGRLFAAHFAGGGTLETLDVPAARIRLAGELAR